MVTRYYPHGYFETDKFGRPVYVELVGQVDLNQLFTFTT